MNTPTRTTYSLDLSPEKQADFDAWADQMDIPVAIERWWDRSLRLWTLIFVSSQKDQVGEAHYETTRAGADAEQARMQAEIDGGSEVTAPMTDRERVELDAENAAKILDAAMTTRILALVATGQAPVEALDQALSELKARWPGFHLLYVRALAELAGIPLP